jgi:chromosome segregation ATPase
LIHLAKERDIEEALSQLRITVEDLEAELLKYREENSSLRRELDAVLKSHKDIVSLEQELQQKTELIGKLRHDVVQLQSHLSEAMRCMKKGNSEDTVDKKLIANLIIGFVTLAHGDTKRYEILQLIASILKLSDEEKQKLGLLRTETTPTKLKASTPTQGEVL